jgi:Putative quorum-sensing-regulated virulence factor
MSFGKHKGLPLTEVPDQYLEWALRECGSLGQRMRRAIETELDRRFAESDAQVTIDIPAAAQGLVTTWYRRMALKYHPDRGGSQEAMKVINAGVELFRELAGGKP